MERVEACDVNLSLGILRQYKNTNIHYAGN
jgi:hypothetical protein